MGLLKKPWNEAQGLALLALVLFLAKRPPAQVLQRVCAERWIHVEKSLHGVCWPERGGEISRQQFPPRARRHLCASTDFRLGALQRHMMCCSIVSVVLKYHNRGQGPGGPGLVCGCAVLCCEMLCACGLRPSQIDCSLAHGEFPKTLWVQTPPSPPNATMSRTGNRLEGQHNTLAEDQQVQPRKHQRDGPMSQPATSTSAQHCAAAHTTPRPHHCPPPPPTPPAAAAARALHAGLWLAQCTRWQSRLQ